MSKREFAEVVGIVAVVASLLFLAYEIRQSNRIARSTVTFELANNSAEIQEIIWTSPVIAELQARAADPGYELTESEEIMMRAQVRRHMNLWGAVEVAFRNGHQTREQLDIMLDEVESTIRRLPATHAIWRDEMNNYEGLGVFEFYQRALLVAGS